MQGRDAQNSPSLWGANMKVIALVTLLGFLTGPALAEGCWTRLADMPTARSEISVTALGGELYVAGGIRLWGGTQKAFESYMIAEDRWVERADLPHRLHHVALAALDGKIYASGGYTSLRFTPNDPQLWAYDPQTDQWQRKADMPGPRGEHAMIAAQGKLWLFGGRGETGRPVWSYDPATDRWSDDHAPMPTYRHSATAIHDPQTQQIIVMGGRGDDYKPLNTFEIYHMVEDRWETAGPLPTPRAGHGAALVGRAIHVWGGETPQADVLKSHDTLDLDTGMWNPGAALPHGRHGVASIGAGNAGYVIGGATSAGWRTIYSAKPWIERYLAKPCP